eukprot:m.43008 g.43008  ORF g.43008 m.43008 type:complete len:408 (-) comp9940_c0_seq2:87-1310(-)
MFQSLFGEDKKNNTEHDKDTEDEKQEQGESEQEDFFGSFLASTAKLAQKVKKAVNENVSKVAKGEIGLVGDFQDEQRKFINSKRKLGREAAVPPWVGCDNEDELKEKILSLSTDKRNFIRDPPAGQQLFEFDFEEAHPVAMAILAEDQNLEKMRFDLVPKTCSEEGFWRNYFYRVALIRQSTEVSSMGAQQDNTREHGNDEGLDNFEQVNAETFVDEEGSKVKQQELLGEYDGALDDDIPDDEESVQSFVEEPEVSMSEANLGPVDLSALDKGSKTLVKQLKKDKDVPETENIKTKDDGSKTQLKKDEEVPENENKRTKDKVLKSQLKKDEVPETENKKTKEVIESTPPSPEPPQTLADNTPVSSDPDWEKELADELEGFELDDDKSPSVDWEEVAEELEMIDKDES